MGSERYPEARKLLITADSGGSNSAWGKLWETELQRLAAEIGIEIHVCHFPPGTSKWNKIEYRLFSYTSKFLPVAPKILILYHSIGDFISG
jgi:hypothetical protein